MSLVFNHVNFKTFRDAKSHIAKDLNLGKSQKVQNNLIYFPLADDEKVKSDSISFSLLDGH